MPSEELALKKALLARGSGRDYSLGDGVGEDGEGEPAECIVVSLADSPWRFRIFRSWVEYEPGHYSTAPTRNGVQAFGQVLKWLGDWMHVAERERAATFELRLLDAQFGSWQLTERTGNAGADDAFDEKDRAAVDADLIAFAAAVGHRFDAVREQLGAVQAKLDELSAEQSRILEVVDELRRSTDRLGKKDWAAAAIGAVLSVISSAVIPPELARQLWLDFLAQLSHARMLVSP